MTPELVKKMNAWDWGEKNSFPFPVNQEGGGRGILGSLVSHHFLFYRRSPLLASHRGAWIPPRQIALSCFQWALLSFDKCLTLNAAAAASAAVSRWILYSETWGDNKLRLTAWIKQASSDLLVLVLAPSLSLRFVLVRNILMRSGLKQWVRWVSGSLLPCWQFITR